jgi:hypothetical protein
VCCRTTIEPLMLPVAEAALEIGQFVRAGSIWRRWVEEEQTAVEVRLEPDRLAISLSPAVTHLDGHAGKRVAASIMYEIAAKYAERAGGIIFQSGINVTECRMEGSGTRLIAAYPDLRLDFGSLCPGFRAVFLGEM